MTDLNYLIEAMLLLALPLAPVAAGMLLRKKYSQAGKAGRLAGSLLLWGGLSGVLFVIVVLLNFKGKI